MAFPYLSEETFDGGTVASTHFDAQSPATFLRMGLDSYKTLAKRQVRVGPYRGAYCLRADLTSTTDHYLQETGSWDTNAAGTIFFRMMVCLDDSPVMADADMFSFFQLWSAVNTVEVSVGIQYTTANGYRFYINETETSAGASFYPLTLGKWHCVEVKAVIDSGAGNDGTIDAWIDGAAMTQIAALDQGAITSGIIGAVGVDATTTRGCLLIDQVVADDARVYPIKDEFPEDLHITTSQHVFVGEGVIENATLLSGGATDNVLQLFDTDTADTNDFSNIRLELKNVANSDPVDPAGVPCTFKRGCYVKLAGTNPRAMLKIGSAQGYRSHANIRSLGLRK